MKTESIKSLKKHNQELQKRCEEGEIFESISKTSRFYIGLAVG